MPDVAPLAAELRFALNRLHRRLRYQSVGDDLTISQLSVLWVLQHHGPLSAGDLAAKEHVRPPSMTRIIAALDAQGLVTRRGHPSDGRQVVVALTEAGEHRAAAETAARDKWLAQQLAQGTTFEDREKIREVVRILNHIADG
jgi:DNA-binding MarR family transcriptional regulator